MKLPNSLFCQHIFWGVAGSQKPKDFKTGSTIFFVCVGYFFRWILVQVSKSFRPLGLSKNPTVPLMSVTTYVNYKITCYSPYNSLFIWNSESVLHVKSVKKWAQRSGWYLVQGISSRKNDLKNSTRRHFWSGTDRKRWCSKHYITQKGVIHKPCEGWRLKGVNQLNVHKTHKPYLVKWSKMGRGPKIPKKTVHMVYECPKTRTSGEVLCVFICSKKSFFFILFFFLLINNTGPLSKGPTLRTIHKLRSYRAGWMG